MRTIDTRRGFTLIELLVTISLLALVMGALAYGLMMVRHQSRIGQTRAILQAAQAAAVEYQQRTGRSISTHPDAWNQWTDVPPQTDLDAEWRDRMPPLEVDDGPHINYAIRWFVIQAREVPEVEELLNARDAGIVRDGDTRDLEAGDDDDVVVTGRPVTMVDGWGNELEYRSRATASGDDSYDHLKPHPRPFFASPGPSQVWHDWDDEESDNIYSFELD